MLWVSMENSRGGAGDIVKGIIREVSQNLRNKMWILRRVNTKKCKIPGIFLKRDHDKINWKSREINSEKKRYSQHRRLMFQ